jgi:hypothetical protein
MPACVDAAHRRAKLIKAAMPADETRSRQLRLGVTTLHDAGQGICRRAAARLDRSARGAQILRRPAGAEPMTPQKIAAFHPASGSVESLRRMPLAARARIESEAEALLVLLAQARGRAKGNHEAEAAVAVIEELVAQVLAQLIAARM